MSERLKKFDMMGLQVETKHRGSVHLGAACGNAPSAGCCNSCLHQHNRSSSPASPQMHGAQHSAACQTGLSATGMGVLGASWSSARPSSQPVSQNIISGQYCSVWKYLVAKFCPSTIACLLRPAKIRFGLMLRYFAMQPVLSFSYSVQLHWSWSQECWPCPSTCW